MIELLIVIAIIAILATIMIVNIRMARARAIDVKVLSELSSAQKDIVSCIIDGGAPGIPEYFSWGGAPGLWFNRQPTCDTPESSLMPDLHPFKLIMGSNGEPWQYLSYDGTAPLGWYSDTRTFASYLINSNTDTAYSRTFAYYAASYQNENNPGPDEVNHKRAEGNKIPGISCDMTGCKKQDF